MPRALALLVTKPRARVALYHLVYSVVVSFVTDIAWGVLVQVFLLLAATYVEYSYALSHMLIFQVQGSRYPSGGREVALKFFL